MRVGCGVTTYKRPEVLRLFLRQLQDNTVNYYFHIAYDRIDDRKGIAHRKNECLRILYESGCDYIFLFDDDCFPVKKGWMDFFIQAHERTGQDHFLYLKELGELKKTGEQDGIDIYNLCGGVFMFLTRKVIEEVGGFNPRYKIYGYEHGTYSMRVHNAGLTPMGAYLCPQGSGEFIYSLDWDRHLTFPEVQHMVFKDKPFGFESSLNDEMDKLPEYLKENGYIFHQDLLQIKQPL